MCLHFDLVSQCLTAFAPEKNSPSLPLNVNCIIFHSAIAAICAKPFHQMAFSIMLLCSLDIFVCEMGPGNLRVFLTVSQEKVGEIIACEP